jgi:DNA-binding transcriptional MerR regulator
MSINAVAARLGLSVHQLRRWELMFGLEIKRGRGQQRQYRAEDLSVLERIKELVEQGWPTSQIRPQLEAEGLVTPKLIGLPTPPGNPEVLMEAMIGLRNFTERRFIEISKQIDDLRQLLITVTLKQELEGETASPWQPLAKEYVPETHFAPPEEIAIGPAHAGPPVELRPKPVEISKPFANLTAGLGFNASPTAAPPPPQPERLSLGEVTDQNYLTVLGRALDLVGWSDEQADSYSQRAFAVAHWDELGRSQAEALIDYLLNQLHEAAAQTDESESYEHQL